MVTGKHYINEVGGVVIVNTEIDISNATTHQLKVKKPDGTLVTWDSELYTVDGETTRLRYVTFAGDLDQPGKYLIQPYIVLPTWSGYGQTSYFIIYNLFN